MQRFRPLLLEVWRESCRHIEIGESIAILAPMLARHLPLDLIVIRRVDLQRRCVEIAGAAALGGASVPPGQRRGGWVAARGGGGA